MVYSIFDDIFVLFFNVLLDPIIHVHNIKTTLIPHETTTIYYLFISIV